MPIFWSVSLNDQQLRRYRTFYKSSLTTMLNDRKKKNKKKKKKNSNFTIVLTTLVETLPRYGL